MILFIACALCAAISPATPPAAQIAASAGIQYDEISRTIMMGATPPPPGSFQTDYAQVHEGKIISVNPMMAQMPKMPVMPKMGVGSILGAIMNPIAALTGMAMQAAMGGAVNGIMNKYRDYETGQLQHFAYYGDYASFENKATKHLIITDSGKQRQYDLDLQTQSYKIVAYTVDWRAQMAQTTAKRKRYLRKCER